MQVADVEGRVDDVFVYAGGVVVHPHVFRSVLGRDRGILEYQVHQTAHGADVLAVGVPGDRTSIERLIAAELRRMGVRDPLVNLGVVPRLDRQATGKMRRFVPRLP